jgi:hypothetical protein
MFRRSIVHIIVFIAEFPLSLRYMMDDTFCRQECHETSSAVDDTHHGMRGIVTGGDVRRLRARGCVSLKRVITRTRPNGRHQQSAFLRSGRSRIVAGKSSETPSDRRGPSVPGLRCMWLFSFTGVMRVIKYQYRTLKSFVKRNR